MIELLPLSYDELLLFEDPPLTIWAAVFQGGYPRIVNEQIPPSRWLSDYVRTYIERDVRQLTQVGDLYAFSNFLKLVAGRTACELNQNELGADAGVTQPTAKSWYSILEASYLCLRLPSFASSVTSRVIKRPKIHMLDSGLACDLLGIQSAEVLTTHPLRGAIFESWVATEIYKYRVHRRQRAAMHHFRQSSGTEVDILLDTGQKLIACEVKSGSTFQSSFVQSLSAASEKLARPGVEVLKRLVYGGDAPMSYLGVEVIPWNQIAKFDW